MEHMYILLYLFSSCNKIKEKHAASLLSCLEKAPSCCT
uniref:Uncharacterized protein n=1 Tax=Siphoviridae sp. ctt1f11 TaxID=2827959 RepID=A0A8S5SCT7_9CAUD|nr:MAG TPA: hypothetical protein [Siphoviridae sp. ctt1f11]